MQISEELRQSVVRSLPEVNEIGDETLRNKVIDAWAYSLGKSSFKSIDEIRASGKSGHTATQAGTPDPSYPWSHAACHANRRRTDGDVSRTWGGS